MDRFHRPLGALRAKNVAVLFLWFRIGKPWFVVTSCLPPADGHCLRVLLVSNELNTRFVQSPGQQPLWYALCIYFAPVVRNSRENFLACYINR
ncbi:hypothetical protein EDD18DRAFT_1152083 [Armillaria luteobubalina]|uniref:Uncharacterized protein n=1 Tax=Armillaria luteobubalina TaxID=153913 RepID=A0AA39UZP1_9AGAR|nr:hypothetical protein EDD18DRAFT_1152083 [Armillaria luteobubalina]